MVLIYDQNTEHRKRELRKCSHNLFTGAVQVPLKTAGPGLTPDFGNANASAARGQGPGGLLDSIAGSRP